MLKKEELTKVVIGAAIKVHKHFGSGFLERVYEKSLAIELRKQGLSVDVQRQMDIYYSGEFVGSYFADIVVNDSVLLELKACTELTNEHKAQLLHYLKATDIKVGLLINFGKEKLDFKRYINLSQET